MKYLKNKISIPGLTVLAFLSCRVEAAPGVADYSALHDAGDAAPSLLDLLLSLVYFDARSLFWLLVGGALVAVFMFPISRKQARAEALRNGLKMPTEVNPSTNGEVSGRTLPDEESAYSTEHWIGLEEATTVTVEEMTGVEEEAEVFLMAGRPDVAIKVLRDYLDSVEDSKESVWFKLLDIYHVQGMREPFFSLAEEIKTRFNVELPTWEQSDSEAELRHGLDHFPRLLGNIVQQWNEPYALEYLHGLMRDNRHGERHGFNEDAFRELLMLSEVLEAREKPDG